MYTYNTSLNFVLLRIGVTGVRLRMIPIDRSSYSQIMTSRTLGLSEHAHMDVSLQIFHISNLSLPRKSTTRSVLDLQKVFRDVWIV